MFNLKSATSYPASVKFNAMSGRLTVDDGGEPREIPPPAGFVFDFGSATFGWVKFETGEAPVRLMVPLTDAAPEQPDEVDDEGRRAFKEAFAARLTGPDLPGVCEWLVASKAVGGAMQKLYEKYVAAQEAADSLIPCVTMMSVTAAQSGKGAKRRTLYVPDLRIDGWVPRAAEFGPRTVALPARTRIAARPRPIPPPPTEISDDNIPF